MRATACRRCGAAADQRIHEGLCPACRASDRLEGLVDGPRAGDRSGPVGSGPLDRDPRGGSITPDPSDDGIVIDLSDAALARLAEVGEADDPTWPTASVTSTVNLGRESLPGRDATVTARPVEARNAGRTGGEPARSSRARPKRIPSIRDLRKGSFSAATRPEVAAPSIAPATSTRPPSPPVGWALTSDHPAPDPTPHASIAPAASMSTSSPPPPPVGWVLSSEGPASDPEPSRGRLDPVDAIDTGDTGDHHDLVGSPAPAGADAAHGAGGAGPSRGSVTPGTTEATEPIQSSDGVEPTDGVEPREPIGPTGAPGTSGIIESTDVDGLRDLAAAMGTGRTGPVRGIDPVSERSADLLAPAPSPGRSARSARSARSDDPSTTPSVLESDRAKGIDVLHDRVAPGCGKPIDRLVIAPTGVWVVDAFEFAGRVAPPESGRWWHRSSSRFVVGGRNRMDLIGEVQCRVGAIRGLLAPVAPAVPVRGCLCFQTHDMGRGAPPFVVGGVLIAAPPDLVVALAAGGPVDGSLRTTILAALEGTLAPAR